MSDNGGGVTDKPVPSDAKIVVQIAVHGEDAISLQTNLSAEAVIILFEKLKFKLMVDLSVPKAPVVKPASSIMNFVRGRKS